MVVSSASQPTRGWEECPAHKGLGVRVRVRVRVRVSGFGFRVLRARAIFKNHFLLRFPLLVFDRKLAVWLANSILH